MRYDLLIVPTNDAKAIFQIVTLNDCFSIKNQRISINFVIFQNILGT